MLDDMRITVRPDGSVRFRTVGRRVQMTAPTSGPLEITVGFRDHTVGDASDQCSRGQRAFP